MPEPNRQTLRDNAATLLGQVKEQRAPFSRVDAEAIRAPTLLMAGDRSPASFHHTLDGLETALKDVRRVVIPNASHSSNIDNPQAFERAVLDFLRDDDRRSTTTRSSRKDAGANRGWTQSVYYQW
jgi:esterase